MFVAWLRTHLVAFYFLIALGYPSMDCLLITINDYKLCFFDDLGVSHG